MSVTCTPLITGRDRNPKPKPKLSTTLGDVEVPFGSRKATITERTAGACDRHLPSTYDSQLWSVPERNFRDEFPRISARILPRCYPNRGGFIPEAQAPSPMSAAYISPSSSLASSDMRSWLQGGVQTSFTRTSLTPATAATARCTWPGSAPATGQAGVVSVIST